MRACILAVIPGDVVEAALNQCEFTLRAKADTSPEAIQKMVDKFSKLGITKEQIEKQIQRRLNAIQPAQVVALRKIYNSLDDGMSVASDWFEPDAKPSDTSAGEQENSSRTDKLKDSLKARSQKKEAPPPPPKDEEEEPEFKTEPATISDLNEFNQTQPESTSGLVLE